MTNRIFLQNNTLQQRQICYVFLDEMKFFLN